MTWTKLSDDYGDETWSLSDRGFRLLTECLVWSNRRLLDCRIPLADLRRFARDPEAYHELVDGRWAELDSDVLVIRYHAAYQPLRESVIARSEANAANGRKGGRPRKPTANETQSLSQSKAESLSETRTHRDGTG